MKKCINQLNNYTVTFAQYIPCAQNEPGMLNN